VQVIRDAVLKNSPDIAMRLLIFAAIIVLFRWLSRMTLTLAIFHVAVALSAGVALGVETALTSKPAWREMLALVALLVNQILLYLVLQKPSRWFRFRLVRKKA
jgi:hypothetical protein